MTRPAMSVQLYSVRDALDVDTAGTLRRIADLGFRNVEPYGLASGAVRLRGPLGDLGLEAPTAHASVLGADLDELLDAAAATRTGLVIEPAVRPERWSSADSVRRVAAELSAAAGAAASGGMRVGYHNHWWELEPLPDGTIPLELFASELDDAVVLEVDTYWAAVGGSDPAELLSRLGERVVAVHVKDGPVSRQTNEQLPAGRGGMPIDAILAAAPDARPVLEFDDYAGDLFEGLAESKAHLERLGVSA